MVGFERQVEYGTAMVPVVRGEACIVARGG